jgi:hypothetical protein
MIHPYLKASLPARQPFHQFPTSTPGTACALTGFRLEYRPQPGVVVSSSVQRLSIPVIPFRRVRNICPAQVNAQNPMSSLRFGHFFLDLDVDIKLTILAFAESGRSRLPALEFFYLAVTHHQGNAFPSVQGGETNALFFRPVVKQARIIIHRRSPEFLNLSHLAVSGNSGTSPDSQVGGQAELLSDGSVNFFLNTVLVSHAGANGTVDVSASLSEALQNLVQPDNLLCSGIELTDNGQYLLWHEFMLCASMVIWQLKLLKRLSSPH